MSHNPRFTLNSSIKNISISHRGRQVIHDSFLRNKSQITRPLYITDPRGQSTTYSYDIVPRSHPSSVGMNTRVTITITKQTKHR